MRCLHDVVWRRLVFDLFEWCTPHWEKDVLLYHVLTICAFSIWAFTMCAFTLRMFETDSPWSYVNMQPFGSSCCFLYCCHGTHAGGTPSVPREHPIAMGWMSFVGWTRSLWDLLEGDDDPLSRWQGLHVVIYEARLLNIYLKQLYSTPIARKNLYHKVGLNATRPLWQQLPPSAIRRLRFQS